MTTLNIAEARTRETPNRPPLTTSIVHAGHLIADKLSGPLALTRYLSRNRTNVVLLHDGDEALHGAAREAHVEDLDVSERPGTNEEEIAAKFAIANRTDWLEFAIDDDTLSDVDGQPLRRLTVMEAMRLSRIRNIDERIRTKLRAGCLALREGIGRVRIGSPRALGRNTATEILPNTQLSGLKAMPLGFDPSTQAMPLAVAAAQSPVSSVAAAASTRYSPWCRHSTHARSRSGGLRSLVAA